LLVIFYTHYVYITGTSYITRFMTSFTKSLSYYMLIYSSYLLFLLSLTSLILSLLIDLLYFNKYLFIFLSGYTQIQLLIYVSIYLLSRLIAIYI